ncbi:MAG TPA: DUF72 domain-containing protein [Thermoanaerobaculia bacterium]|nr:DUF72 domain-containing protein [Thermoanaerobaculia bacterium]
MRDADVRIGTSGWHYRHWIGNFYPEDLKAPKMLDWYGRFFDSVELNNTFYRLPTAKALAAWRDSTPARFLFAVKGSRYLTHMKKLRDPEAGLERFLPLVEILGRKLGPILFQLPPHWSADAGRLDAFLQALPRRHRYAFELRDPSWHTPAIEATLARHHAAFCIFDIAGFHSPEPITADFTYLRLHGPGGKYQGRYSPDVLQARARWVRKWRRGLRAIFVYFDNDQAGYAAENARELKERVER